MKLEQALKPAMDVASKAAKAQKLKSVKVKVKFSDKKGGERVGQVSPGSA